MATKPYRSVSTRACEANKFLWQLSHVATLSIVSPQRPPADRRRKASTKAEADGAANLGGLARAPVQSRSKCPYSLARQNERLGASIPSLLLQCGKERAWSRSTHHTITCSAKRVRDTFQSSLPPAETHHELTFEHCSLYSVSK